MLVWWLNYQFARGKRIDLLSTFHTELFLLSQELRLWLAWSEESQIWDPWKQVASHGYHDCPTVSKPIPILCVSSVVKCLDSANLSERNICSADARWQIRCDAHEHFGIQEMQIMPEVPYQRCLQIRMVKSILLPLSLMSSNRSAKFITITWWSLSKLAASSLFPIEYPRYLLGLV